MEQTLKNSKSGLVSINSIKFYLAVNQSVN